MKIILTGATGFTGSEVLKQALNDPTIEQTTVLSRRSTGMTHARLKEVILENFLDYSGVDLSGYDACVWCLGVSQTQGTEASYIQITYDYTIAAAKAMWAANPALRFCFLSGRGADPTEKSTVLYRKIKGRTERTLTEMSANLFIFRPGFIRPTKATGPRKDFQRWLTPIGTLMGFFNENFAVDGDQLARALLQIAKQGHGDHVFENRAIRNLR